MLALLHVARELRSELAEDDVAAPVDPAVLAEGARAVELAVVPARNPGLHRVAGPSVGRLLERRVRRSIHLHEALGNEPAPLPHPVGEMELPQGRAVRVT